MRFLTVAGTICYAIVLAGCDGGSGPAGPRVDPIDWTQPYAPRGPGGSLTNFSVAGFVIDEWDQCIIPSRVEIMDGPRKGASFIQTVCGFWDYGENLGYSFHGLPPTPVKLSATADGYETAEVVGMPSNPYQYTTYITLTKTP